MACGITAAVKSHNQQNCHLQMHCVLNNWSKLVEHTIWDEIIIFEKHEWPQISYLIHFNVNVKIKKIDKLIITRPDRSLKKIWIFL